MVERQLLQGKEDDRTLDPEILTPWQKRRVKEIQTRLSWLIAEGKLTQENLKGRVIDLGTGSGAGLVALRALGATQAMGVDNGSAINQAFEEISKAPADLLEVFYPSKVLQQKEKIFLISNEEFLRIFKEGGLGVSLVACFWIYYDPPIKQIEEVLTSGGQVIITANKDKDRYFCLQEIPQRTSLETQIIEMPEEFKDRLVNDRFVLIGTKKR